jgi:hypothetical protein
MAEVGPVGILISDVSFILNSLAVRCLQTRSNREKSPVKMQPMFRPTPVAMMNV